MIISGEFIFSQKNLVKKIEYPYQNLELRNLKGERWESIPGFDGAYEVSNLGRIKSLPRWRGAGIGGRGYYTKELIRKQGLRKRYNHFIKEQTFTLCVSIKHEGKTISTSTARFVYQAFVQDFDLEDKTLLISYYDSNGLNLHHSNLFLTNRSNLSKRISQLNRSIPPTGKQAVNQYSIEGKFIACYKSITEASMLTGFHTTGIMACMLGNIYQHKGFRWEYAQKRSVKKKTNDIPDAIFNKNLWKILGRPCSQNKPIPVLNLSPNLIRGEIWKELKGSRGVYSISNFGRIKSVSHLSGGKISTWKKGVVKKLFSDSKKGRKLSCILASFSHEGKKFQIAVGRLVYYHFIKKFKLSDKNKIIQYKDGNCYNLHFKNLILSAR